MKADEVRKISETVRAKVKDIRLDKYIEWLERDVVSAANVGKFILKVNYDDKPLTDSFILQIQDSFIENGFNIVPNEDPTKFRDFTIGWANND